MRIKRREGEFTSRWKKVYREQTDRRALDWLHFMQADEAFDGVVESFTVDGVDSSVLKDMERMRWSEDMRRSACFRMSPCPMAGLCHRGLTPATAGWREKPLIRLAKMVK